MSAAKPDIASLIARDSSFKRPYNPDLANETEIKWPVPFYNCFLNLPPQKPTAPNYFLCVLQFNAQ